MYREIDIFPALRQHVFEIVKEMVEENEFSIFTGKINPLTRPILSSEKWQ